MTDLFRKESIGGVSVDVAARVMRMKYLCEELAKVMVTNRDLGADGRCISLALTKLEESCMWAVKGITAPKEK